MQNKMKIIKKYTDVGADDMCKKISVSIEEDRCFYHVLGDKRKYFDLYSLQARHPELSSYCKKNKLELQRDLLKQKELLKTAN